MREAKRLFARNGKSPNGNESSIFKSKINRGLPDESLRSSIGPGHYNICLPLVKPKFQAIRKNNNTLIIKVNQKLSPAFHSHQPRFKDIRSQRLQEKQGQNEVYGLMPSNSNQQEIEKHRKISLGMKNRINKLNEIIKLQEISDQKKRIDNPKQTINLDKLQNFRGNDEIINSLKLYKKQRERLHFLLKHMKNKNHSKGAEWSKYREMKGNLYTINNVPGPGSYNQTRYRSTNKPIQTMDDKSWQFKSLTKRRYFMHNEDQKQYEIYPSRNMFNNQIDGRFYKVESIPLLNNKSSSQLNIDPQQY